VTYLSVRPDPPGIAGWLRLPVAPEESADPPVRQWSLRQWGGRGWWVIPKSTTCPPADLPTCPTAYLPYVSLLFRVFRDLDPALPGLLLFSSQGYSIIFPVGPGG